MNKSTPTLRVTTSGESILLTIKGGRAGNSVTRARVLLEDAQKETQLAVGITMALKQAGLYRAKLTGIKAE